MISIFSIKNLCILFIINRIAAEECVRKNDCECTFENGFGYDLQAFDETKNFEANSTSSIGLQYFFHPCNDGTTLPDKGKETKNECYSGFGVCLYNASASAYTLLATNKDANFKVNSDSTVYLVYVHGNSTITISLICTTSEQNYLFEGDTAANENEHNLILFSKQACLKEIFIVSTLSTGAVLNITFLIMVFAYLIVGITVDYFLMGARGIEVIPHLAFWKDFPFLVRDGVKFVQNGCKIQPSDLSENRDIYTSI